MSVLSVEKNVVEEYEGKPGVCWWMCVPDANGFSEKLDAFWRKSCPEKYGMYQTVHLVELS